MSEMDKLEDYLREHGIYYERIDEPCNDFMRCFFENHGGFHGQGERHQIIVFDEDGRRAWDVICHFGSYGYDEGLLELMAEQLPDVEGWLSAEDVIARMIEGEYGG